MANKLYALLVGINEYDNPNVSNLQGCVNDVLSVEEMIKKQYSQFDLQIEKLLNQKATYNNIISEFRNHLGKAQADDIVFFHYSGHGAREIAAPEFRQFFSEYYQETLVCYDSRKAGGHDLADKELAVLISEVAKNNPHITIMLDCCHSGSATRDSDSYTLLNSRKTYDRDSPRPLDTYLSGWYENQLKKDNKITIPKSKHIALGACDRKEEARETATHSGVFTTAMLGTLNKSTDISYADIFLKTRRNILKLALNQTPQFESYEYFDANSIFLDPYAEKKNNKNENIFDVYAVGDTWKVDYGAIKGLSTAPEKTYDFALFNENTENFEDANIVGYASVKLVRAERSDLNMNALSNNTEKKYKAKLISIPSPQMFVYIKGDNNKVEAAKDLKPEFLFIELKEDKVGTNYTIEIKNNLVSLYKNNNNLLIQAAKGDFKVAIDYIYSILINITQWERAIDLENKSTNFSDNDIDFKIYKIDEFGKEIELEANPEFNFISDYINIKIKAKHNKNQRLYFSLIYLSEEFGITSIWNEPIEKGNEYITMLENDLFLEDNVSQQSDTFKLIVSTEAVDDFIIEQDDLVVGKTLNFRADEGTRALRLVKNRQLKKVKNDWTTKTISAKIKQQQSSVSASPVNIANDKILIKGHTDFKADIALSGTKTATRSTDAMNIFPNLANKFGSDLLNFKETRGEIENILEFSGIQNHDKLEDNPLEIELKTGLDEHEFVLPFTFDGEDFIPVGDTQKDEKGNTHITINKIPETTEPKSRSLGKSLKLSFMKFVGKKRGLEKLRWVDFAEDGSIKRREYDLKSKIEAAKNILLVVHGIFGDTENIASSMKFAIDEKQYDLVLTFDYENLNTSLQKSAESLNKKLIDAGFDAKDDKKLSILAHSTGGIVVRYLVERLKANSYIDNVILAGVPNKGSIFDNLLEYRKIATTVITILIGVPTIVSFAPAAISGAAALLFGMKQSKKLTASLEQITEDAEFLSNLNMSSDPKVQYYVLAGDIDKFKSKIGNKAKGKMEKIQFKLGSWAFKDEPNDIMVGMESMKNINKHREPKPVYKEIACHHLNYFENEDSLAVLKDIFDLKAEKVDKEDKKV